MQRCVRIDYTLNQIGAVFLSIHLISTQLLNQISAVFLSIHLISTEENIAPDDWYVTGCAIKRRSATLRAN